MIKALRNLQTALDEGFVTKQEFEKRKKAIIDGATALPNEPRAAKGKAAKVKRSSRPTEDQDAPKPIQENSKSSFRFGRRRNRKPKLQESATWLLQLANLLRSGMPLTLALNSMVSISGKGISEEIAEELKKNVTEGKTLSEAMSKHPVVFNEMSINMVRAGEESGALEQVLRRLSIHFDRFAEVQSKFISAMIYPAIVCLVGFSIVLFFMVFMLPKFKDIFDDMGDGASLPPGLLGPRRLPCRCRQERSRPVEGGRVAPTPRFHAVLQDGR